MQVEHVDFVSVPTRDLPRALAFYREVLGLPESEYSDGELETPNVTLSFWNPETDGEPFQANNAGLALRVDGCRGRGRGVPGGGRRGDRHPGQRRLPHGRSSRISTATSLILHRRYAPKEKREQD